MLRLFLFLLVLLVGVWPAGSAFGAALEPSAGTSPPAGLEEEGVYLLIDKSENRLTVIVNGRAAYGFPVATGRTKDLTPTGTFHIVTKIVKPWYVRKQIPGGDPRNPLGTRWMGINVPGSGGYRYGIHGTNRPYSIGSSASSGCVRMHNRDVEWLYRHIPLGTAVIIQD
ncbi:L,D-transpeptidase [Paenibacillus oleatilyticus]|uniref:L,D-transpeptidase n=1 Tax=Paenibacillus oleatilyticus TaxID=2594886 RepID=UPI001C1FCD13|nr:L,D-transpeptidase [Paenibacillus oleatilyticus]MBU7319785.1 L,D-transpeptidase [Paenibacillus oleatilyticus]